MKLMQLKYFQTACRMNSITKAAEQLHVSQPSVSAAIKDLEHEFGVLLFSRQYRGFTLTQEGVAFLEQADSLLEKAEQCREIMKDIAQKRNLLRLGIPPMIGSVLLPKVCKMFSQRSPDTILRIYEAGRKDLLGQLSANELDLVFLPHDSPFGPEYKWVHLGVAETVFCISEHHALANRRSVAIHELSEELLVLFKDSFFQNELIVSRFAQAGIKPRILLNTSQLSTIISMIRSETASGFLFNNISENNPGLISIPLDPPLRTEISLVWKRGDFMFNDKSRFIDCIRELY